MCIRDSSTIKSISMLRHKTDFISIHTLKTIHFRPPHRNQVNSDPYTDIDSISTTYTTTNSISSLHWNQVKFHPPHWNPTHNQVISGLHIQTKSISTTHPKTKSIDPRTKNKTFSSHTRTPGQLWPAKKQLNFDPHAKTKSISVPDTKSQVNFDPNTDDKSISTTTLKTR